MFPGTDQTEALCDAVRQAFESGRPLTIAGSGSKAFLTGGSDDTGAAPARLLSTVEHRGVIAYRPEELVITARSGTLLKEIEVVLAQAGQHLPFEPPQFRGGGTLGGAVACGLSGPGRPWWGAARDVVLGVELINGSGQPLRFGGQVMKNVAGYDVSRLQAGAFGTLGLLLSLSIKVLPEPPAMATRVFELDCRQAQARCREWACRPLPVSATCYLEGLLRVRLSGAEPAVEEGAAEIGGDPEHDPRFWESLRDHRLDFFMAPGLWRCAVPPAAPEPLEDCLIEWAGAQRWWRPPADVDVRATVAKVGGHARPFDGSFGARAGAHLSAAERCYAARLKAAFDPAGILNRELGPSPESKADAD